MKFRPPFSRKNKIISVIKVITLITTAAILIFLFRKTDTRLPDIPLIGVTGEWADSVFQTLTPAAKIELLLLTPDDPSIDKGTKYSIAFITGGTLPKSDSLRFCKEFIYGNRRQSTTGIHWLPSPENIPDYPLPFETDQLLSVSDDSLLLRYIYHHLSVVQSTGSHIVQFPLWRSLPHTPQKPDIFYLQRQTSLFKEFCRKSLEYGIIPGIAVPDFVIKHHRISTSHDSLILYYFRKLIDHTTPIMVAKSTPTLSGATTFRQSLLDRFGFRGLLILEEPVNGHTQFFQNLTQGFDIQVNDPSSEILIQRASEQYLRDKQSRKMVDTAVMRVLLYREWLMGNHSSIHPDILPIHKLRKLHLELINGGLILLNDHHGLVPLEATSAVCVHVPTGINFSRFTSIIDLFAPTEVREYKLARRLSLKAGAFQVVIAVDGQLPVHEGWRQAADKGQMMLVHFGSPDSLNKLEGTGLAIIQAGDTTANYQAAAANAIFGGLICNGIIPRDLYGTLRGGTKSATGALVRVQHTIPEAFGFTANFLTNIDSIIQEAISNGAFPGCQVYIAIRGKVICNNAYGVTAWEQGVPVKTSHLYDLASVTKVASTTLAFMKMQEMGKMRTTDPLGKFIKHKGKQQPLNIPNKGDATQPARTIFGVTMYELLIHTSGLPASLPIPGYTGGLQGGRDRTPVYFNIANLKDSADIEVAKDMYLYRWAFDTLWNRSLGMVPNAIRKYLYSDANMVLLQQAIDSVNGIPVNEFMKKEFYEPLGLRYCTFNPLRSHPLAQIVPTALDLRWRRQLLQGTVHDPLAALFGGVAGHAGLFSNAHDLGVIGQMLLNGGTYGGTRFLDTNTVRLFTTKQRGVNRGMGFDIPVAGNGIIAQSSPATCFGHTGFTGTCLWIDPENGIVFAFVSNRIHPNPENQKINFFKVRERLHQAIYDEMRLNSIPFTGRAESR
jgi:CubicO group peptidase (beta-lactamase class C family)